MGNGDLYKKTMKGLLTMSVSSVVVFILQFITTLILARIFTPSEFGIVSAITIVTSYTDIFWQVGIGPAIVQKSDLKQDDIRTGFTTSIGLGIVATVLIVAASPLLKQLINIEDSMMLNVIAISFAINSIGVVPLSLLQREMRFNVIIKKDIYSSLCYAIVAVILGLTGIGVWALIIALLSKYILAVVISWFACPTKLSFGFNEVSFKEMIRFGGGFTLSRFFNVTANQGDYLVITRTMGSYSLGIYNKAFQLIAVPSNLLGQVLDQVFFPAMSKVQDDDKKLSEIHTMGVAFLALAYIPIGILIYFFAEEIVLILLGKTWVETTVPLKILSLFIFFRVAYKMSDPLCRAKGAVYRRALIQMLFALMIVVFASAGSHYGLAGVSMGVGCALLANYLIMTLFVYKLIRFDINYYLRCLLPVFIGGIIILLAGNMLKQQIEASQINIVLTDIILLCIIILLEVVMAILIYRYIWPQDLCVRIREQIFVFFKRGRK